MTACPCPHCRQMVSPSARVCEHCYMDLTKANGGHGLTFKVLAVMLAGPLIGSAMARGSNPTIVQQIRNGQTEIGAKVQDTNPTKRTASNCVIAAPPAAAAQENVAPNMPERLRAAQSLPRPATRC